MLKTADMRTEITAISKICGDYLIRDVADDPAAFFSGPDPESIAAGNSGTILFMIGLYEHTKENAYAQYVNKAIESLYSYCRDTTTSNYALYTGRSGVVYVLIQWYRICKDRELLRKAISLAIPANREYLYSRYTSDYLFDGRSGTLLVITYLYLLTEQSLLLPHIREFASGIIANAKFSPEGVFWTAEEEINIHPSCGFAKGVSGILYALSRLNSLVDDPTIDFMIGEAHCFQNACWQGKYQCRGNSLREIPDNETLLRYREAYMRQESDLYVPREEWGWASGATGLLISSLADANTGFRDYFKSRLFSAIEQKAFRSDNLYDGLAGAGLYLWGAETAESLQVPAIIDAVLNRLQLSSPLQLKIGGLLYGDLGKIYFLLKATARKASNENILIPLAGVESELKDTKIDLKIDHAALRTTCLKQYYPRTLDLLEKKAKDGLKKYLATPFLSFSEERRAFGSLINQSVGVPHTLLKCLADVHGLEDKKVEFFFSDTRSSFQIFLEDWHQRSKVLGLLNGTENWLMRQMLVISPKTRLLSSKWDWSFFEESTQIRERQNENIDTAPGRFEYILQLYGGREIVEFALKRDGSMLLHLFDRPKRVDQALSEIDGYVRSLASERLQELLFSVSDSQEVNDYLDKLADTVLFTIRQWVYRGTLIVNQGI